MEEHRKKIKLKVKENRKPGFDRYISILSKAIGLLFIGFSFYFFVDSQGNDFLKKIIEFFTSSNDSQIIYKNTGEFPLEIIISLLIGYLPGVFGILTVQHYSKKYNLSANKYLLPILIFMAIYNTIMCFYWIYYCGFFYYYNYFIAGSLLLLSLSLFFKSYLVNKNKSLLIAIIIFFHAFMLEILFQSNNENRYLYVFIPISIFSIALYFITQGNKNNLSNILNGCFSYLFLILFVIKKIVLNNSQSNLYLYISISIVFYILFYLITFMYYLEEKKKIYTLLNLLNTVLFITLTSYVFSRFNLLNSIYSVVFLVLLIHLLSVFFSSKLHPKKRDLKHYEFISIILVSSFMPLVLNDYFISLFLGAFCLFLFLYARNYKIKSLMPIVNGLTFLMVSNIIYIVANTYLSILYSPDIGFYELNQTTFINIAIVLIVTFFLKILIKKSTEADEEKNWFNRKKYVTYLNGFLALMILLAIEWSVFSILFSNFYVDTFSNRVALLIFSFFLFFIFKKWHSFSNKLRQWFSFSLLIYSILYLSQIYFLFSFEKFNYIASNNLLMVEIVLHYLELLLAFSLIYITSLKINSYNYSAFKEFFKFLLILLCFFITLICCFEYDYLSILMSEFSFDKLTFEKYQIIITSNVYLPYSIITLICSSLMIIFGFNIKNKITQITSLVVFGITIFKIIYLDFTMISDSAKSLAFIVIGVLLLSLSWFYNSTNKKKKKRVSSNV
jgi:hypothetical protein